MVESLPRLPGAGGHPGIDTLVIVGDTHYLGVYIDPDPQYGDPNVRQITAVRGVTALNHPLGGVIRPPAVIQIGDLKHEDNGPLDGFGDNFDLVLDGNHDQNDVRDYIIARFGSLTWGRKIGPIYVQAMTETYTAPLDTTPPSADQINNVIAPLLALRPPGEPTFLMFHRALTPGGGGGYLGEWDPAALDALDTLAKSINCVGIFFGHNHYEVNSTWQHTTKAFPMFSPGSVAQSPMNPPFATTYAESFLVVRMAHDHYDVACYCFGFDNPANTRVWDPGWKWSERVDY